MQRKLYITNKMLQIRKELLDTLDFVWKVESAEKNNKNKTFDKKKWHQQYEKLVKFQRKNGHCMVGRSYKQDKSLGEWRGYMRSGSFITRTNCDLIESNYWTHSSSYGKLKPSSATGPTRSTRSGTSSVKSWSSFNARMAIVWFIGTPEDLINIFHVPHTYS
jgi:hypothetical protein